MSEAMTWRKATEANSRFVEVDPVAIAAEWLLEQGEVVFGAQCDRLDEFSDAALADQLVTAWAERIGEPDFARLRSENVEPFILPGAAAPIGAAEALRDDPFEAHFARLGENERALAAPRFVLRAPKSLCPSGRKATASPSRH